MFMTNSFYVYSEGKGRLNVIYLFGSALTARLLDADGLSGRGLDSAPVCPFGPLDVSLIHYWGQKCPFLYGCC